MIRIVASNIRSRVPIGQSSTRAMITSAQKRALQKDQIDGKQTETVISASSSESVLPSSSTHEVSPSASSGILPVILVAAAGIGGGAYYMGMFPDGYIPKGLKDIMPQKNKVLDTKIKSEVSKEKTGSVGSATSVVNSINSSPSKSANMKTTIIDSDSTAPIKENAQDKDLKKEEDVTSSRIAKADSVNGNRVVQIYAPSSVGRKSEMLPAPGHPENGNRVSVSLESKILDKEKINPVPKVVVTVAAPNNVKSTLADDELKVSTLGPSIIDAELARSESIMKSALEQTLNGLDDLTPSELRIKVIQLVTELGERTKWEAVRLKEFLSMKEKEVGEK